MSDESLPRSCLSRQGCAKVVDAERTGETAEYHSNGGSLLNAPSSGSERLGLLIMRLSIFEEALTTV